MKRIIYIVLTLIALSTGNAVADDFGKPNKGKTSFVFDDSKYMNTATPLLKVLLNGEPLQNAEVGYFAATDDECRGGNMTNDKGYVWTNIYGSTNNVEIYFIVKADGKTYRSKETYLFQIDDHNADANHPGILPVLSISDGEQDSKENMVIVPSAACPLLSAQTKVEIPLTISTELNRYSKMSCTITLPEGWTLTTPTKNTLCKSKYFSVTKTATGNGVNKVTVAPSQTAISEGVDTIAFFSQKGDLLTLPVNVPANTAMGLYDVKVTDIQFTTFYRTTAKVEDVTATVAVGKGDVNKDGQVSIADISAMVEILNGRDNTEPYKYNHQAADMDNSSSVTLSDLTLLKQLLLEKK